MTESKMGYDTFKEIIHEELKNAPEGLSWTQIRKKRP